MGMAMPVTLAALAESVVRLGWAAPVVKLGWAASVVKLGRGAQVVAQGMLRGLHDTFVPMLFALFGYWVIGIGVGAWLAFERDWGGVGIWTGLATGLSIVAVLMLTRWMQRERLGLLPATGA